MISPFRHFIQSLATNLIIQILLASHFDFLLELRRGDGRVENVERIECRLDEYLVNLVEEILDSVVLRVVDLGKGIRILRITSEVSSLRNLPSQTLRGWR